MLTTKETLENTCKLHFGEDNCFYYSFINEKEKYIELKNYKSFLDWQLASIKDFIEEVKKNGSIRLNVAGLNVYNYVDDSKYLTDKVTDVIYRPSRKKVAPVLYFLLSVINFRTTDVNFIDIHSDYSFSVVMNKSDLNTIELLELVVSKKDDSVAYRAFVKGKESLSSGRYVSCFNRNIFKILEIFKEFIQGIQIMSLESDETQKVVKENFNFSSKDIDALEKLGNLIVLSGGLPTSSQNIKLSMGKSSANTGGFSGLFIEDSSSDIEDSSSDKDNIKNYSLFAYAGNSDEGGFSGLFIEDSSSDKDNIKTYSLSIEDSDETDFYIVEDDNLNREETLIDISWFELNKTESSENFWNFYFEQDMSLFTDNLTKLKPISVADINFHILSINFNGRCSSPYKFLINEKSKDGKITSYFLDKEGTTAYKCIFNFLKFLKNSETFNTNSLIGLTHSFDKNFLKTLLRPSLLPKITWYLCFCFWLYTDKECTNMLDLSKIESFHDEIFLKPQLIDFKGCNDEIGLYFTGKEFKLKNLKTGYFFKFLNKLTFTEIKDIIMILIPFVSKIHLFFDKSNKDHGKVIKYNMGFLNKTRKANKITYNFVE